jgi:thiamine-phosphate pyrophosphorylase
MSGDGRRELLERVRLYLVIEARPHGRPVEEIVEPALAGGVGCVQLREKQADPNEIVAAARRLRSLCDRYGALLVVNDRADLALAGGADGVHVGQDDEPVDAVRERVGPELIVGLSTHTPAQVDAALASSADYLGVGPVYETATKPGVEPVGEELVRYAAARASKPFFAIGGIDARNARRVARAGATRIAVVRAVRDAADPRAAAQALLAVLGREALDAVR